VEEKVGEVIRCLPGHLVYKSLDGIFKEWKVEQEGGRGRCLKSCVDYCDDYFLHIYK